MWGSFLPLVYFQTSTNIPTFFYFAQLIFNIQPRQGTGPFFNLQVLLHTVAARLVLCTHATGKLLPAQVVSREVQRKPSRRFRREKTCSIVQKIFKLQFKSQKK